MHELKFNLLNCGGVMRTGRFRGQEAPAPEGARCSFLFANVNRIFVNS